MAKKPLERVTEPDEGLVHYTPAPIQDAVTLCGKTDWLGETRGERTDAPATCQQCLGMVEYIRRHKAD